VFAGGQRPFAELSQHRGAVRDAQGPQTNARVRPMTRYDPNALQPSGG
jgi:hypothetical protein